MSPSLCLKFMWCVIRSAVCALFSCCFSRRSKAPNLSADVCVVTGAGQGLGRHIALQLAECGATLVLWDVNGEKVRSVAREIRESGGNAHAYVVDCSRREDVYRVAAQVREEVGDVAVLVNNAGVSFVGSYVNGKISDEQITKTFSVNALALFWTVRAFLPWMMENDYGYIVNVASLAACAGSPYVSAYCATKSGVRTFSDSLRDELRLSGKKGISVMCVYPTFINTSMMDADIQKALRAKNIQILQPKDVAKVILRGMGAKQRDLFVPSSNKIVPFLLTITPQDAIDLISNVTVEVLGFDKL